MADMAEPGQSVKFLEISWVEASRDISQIVKNNSLPEA